MLQYLELLVWHISFSSSLSPDSDEKSCLQPALTLTLIFKLIAPRIFELSRSSADAEIVEGVWPDQKPLLLLARLFSFLVKWSYFSLLWAGFFAFSLPEVFFLLLIFR